MFNFLVFSVLLLCLGFGALLFHAFVTDSYRPENLSLMVTVFSVSMFLAIILAVLLFKMSTHPRLATWIEFSELLTEKTFFSLHTYEWSQVEGIQNVSSIDTDTTKIVLTNGKHITLREPDEKLKDVTDSLLSEQNSINHCTRKQVLIALGKLGQIRHFYVDSFGAAPLHPDWVDKMRAEITICLEKAQSDVSPDIREVAFQSQSGIQYRIEQIPAESGGPRSINDWP